MTVRKTKTRQKKTSGKTGKASAKIRAGGKVPAITATTVLSAQEPPPFRLENGAGRGKCLIVCDHASNRVPQSLHNLGLTRSQLGKHIAWDPGTEDIGRIISTALNAPAIFANYSRLVADVNRGAETKECILPVSDRIVVPGNTRLARKARKARIDEIFTPYHRAVAERVNRFLGKKIIPVIISIHSFTPRINGKSRPWHIGVLWNHEEEIATRLVENLRLRNPRLVVGANEPYSLKQSNLSKNTIGTHAESRGLPYIIVEFRQDLVKTPEKAAKWAQIFLEALTPILDDPALYQPRHRRQKPPGR